MFVEFVGVEDSCGVPGVLADAALAVIECCKGDAGAEHGAGEDGDEGDDDHWYLWF